MKLNEFIEGVLTQIMEGVSEAQKNVRQFGGEVCPAPYATSRIPSDEVTATGRRRIQTVSFDVAVTATDESAQEGGLRVAIAGVGVGGKMESSESSTSVSRVRFEVRVALPGPSTPMREQPEPQAGEKSWADSR